MAAKHVSASDHGIASASVAHEQLRTLGRILECPVRVVDEQKRPGRFGSRSFPASAFVLLDYRRLLARRGFAPARGMSQLAATRQHALVFGATVQYFQVPSGAYHTYKVCTWMLA